MIERVNADRFWTQVPTLNSRGAPTCNASSYTPLTVCGDRKFCTGCTYVGERFCARNVGNIWLTSSAQTCPASSKLLGWPLACSLQCIFNLALAKKPSKVTTQPACTPEVLRIINQVSVKLLNVTSFGLELFCVVHCQRIAPWSLLLLAPQPLLNQYTECQHWLHLPALKSPFFHTLAHWSGWADTSPL